MKVTLRLALVVLALCVMGLASGCGGTANVGNLGNFVIALNGFGPYIGDDFYLKVVDNSTGGTVGIANPTAIAADGFSVTIPDIIASNGVYRIDFWVDTDDNGILDRSPDGNPAGVDHSWRLTANGTDSGIATTFAANDTYTDITPF